MRFHKAIRKIHLVASMVMLSFMLIYVFSGIILINRSLFNIPEHHSNEYTIPVEIRMEGSPGIYAQDLKETLEIKGRVNYRQDWKENWIFEYEFPGDYYKVTLTPAQDSLHIEHNQQERSFFTVVQGIHVLRGFKGGWAYTAWAVIYDTSFAAMLIFAITGIIIWFRIRNKFKYGLWFLLAGLAIPLTFIFLFMFWK